MIWWKTAMAGDKVVCVADQEAIDLVAAVFPGCQCPHSGGVYEIREIRDDAPWRRGEEHIVLLLAECDNRHLIGASGEAWRCYVEPGFVAHNFRPVQTKSTETGMSILRKILNGALVKEDA